MPRKAMGSVPPSGNPKVPTPPVRFDENETSQSLTATARGSKQNHVSSSRITKRKSGGGFTGFITYFAVRIFALYAIVAALFTCSSHPFQFNYSAKDPRAVCRSLAHGKSHLVPIVTPLLHSAHEKVDPYTAPYIKIVKPYTDSAWKTARPFVRQAEKQGKIVYNRHLEPMRKKALKKGKTYTDPHVKNFNKHYKKQVQPHLDHFQKAVEPYQDIYKRDVAPYLNNGYSYSLAAAGTSYAFYVKQVHPRVMATLRRLYSFYLYHAKPAGKKAFSVYVRPQVEKLSAKVFERKAHVQGSEAIAEAKLEVKEAAKEGKIRSKEMQAEAEKEAIRKQEDPTLVEKAQHATNHLLGLTEEADEVEVAKLDAQLDAELAKVSEQVEAWENGLDRLIAQEYKTFTERISDLRSRRLADLPDHFALLTETYVEDEVAATLTRLERVYKKLSKSDLSIGDQVTEANKQHSKQKQRLIDSQASLERQIEAYADDLKKDESSSLDASVGEVRRYIVEAQKSIGKIMNDAKFVQTVENNEGWSAGLVSKGEKLEQDLHKLLQGGKLDKSVTNAVDLRKEAKMDSHITDLQSKVKKLYSTATSQVDSYSTSGNLHLRGEGTLNAISDATEAVAEQAKQLAEDAASSMLGVALAARQKLGLAPRETPGILERVQLSLQDATKSAASLVGATPTSKGAVDSATSYVASAVGYKTEPESYLEIIGEKAQEVMDSAASSVEKVAKGANENYVAAVSVVGEGFTAATTSAGNAVRSASSSASDAFTAATTSAGNVYKAASSSVVSILPTELPSLPTELPNGDAAASIFGLAQEQFASISVSAGKVAEAVGSSGSSVVDQVVSNVVDTGSKGLKQGSDSAQDLFASVKAGVESAKEAVVGVVGGEESHLVGKKPEDDDYNTIGKTAEAIKERLVHLEL
ncbi:hypothetical protein CBS101457_005756 [Exobasidium rhododendri]|nr:hypothetical protein CBS101457_005756 [Exobasidium rhododendri]